MQLSKETTALVTGLITVTKNLTRNNSERKGLFGFTACGWMRLAMAAGGVAHTVSVVRKQRAMVEASAQLAFSFVFSLRLQPM